MPRCWRTRPPWYTSRSEEHTSELQSRFALVSPLRPSATPPPPLHDALPICPAIVPNPLATEADLRGVYDGARVRRRLAAAPALAQVTESEREPGARVQSDAEVLVDPRAVVHV